MTNHPLIPKIKTSEIVYKGYFDVRLDELYFPHGEKMSYTLLEIKADAAAILAKTKEGKWIINREYRHPTETWLLSCPGGRIDPGETPLEAAKRELLEETGYGGDPFTLLGAVYPFPTVSKQVIYYLFVEGAEYIQPPRHEPFEVIRTELKTLDELHHEIRNGTPVDGVLCTALFLARLLN